MLNTHLLALLIWSLLYRFGFSLPLGVDLEPSDGS